MRMEGKLIHIKDAKFLGIIEKHSIVFDDGKDAISPMQAVLLSLAACSGMDVWNILIKKRKKIKSFEINIEGKRKEKYPKVFEKIKIEYVIEGDVDEKSCKDAIELSIKKYCSIANMLKADIETSFKIV